MREIRATHDATVLLTTHDMEKADRLCDRIAIIDDGRIIANNTPPGLKGLVHQGNVQEPTLGDVFLELTGKRMEEKEKIE